MDSFTNAGMIFDVTDGGPAGGEPVVLLHGFPADRHCWEGVAGRLADGGFRTLAPDQRGYSRRAAPTGRAAYRIDGLTSDVLALAEQANIERFHLVGHDWGAAVAWHLAAAEPARVATLSAISVPHPAAIAKAWRTSSQALRSWYMLAFQVPVLPDLALGWRRGAGLARALRATGLAAGAADRYASRASVPGGFSGPLGWYRALPLDRKVGTRPVEVPTVMVWGPGDHFIGRRAAAAAVEWVRSSYRFVEIPGGDHWLPEQAPTGVADAIMDLARAYPI